MDRDIDHALADLAAQQKRLLRRDQVLELGVSDRQIYELTQRRRWSAPHPGVYCVGPPPQTFDERLLAGCFAAFPGGFASHRAAARTAHLDGAERHGIVEITVGAGLPEPSGVKVHRTKRLAPGEFTVVNGIPATTMNRTLIDYAAVVPPVLVERAVEDALRRGKTSEGALLRYLGAVVRGTPGKTRLTRVLMGRPEGRAAASGFEVMLLDLIREYGLEIPERRVPIRNQAGVIVAEADLGYPRRRLLLEAHSRKWHSTARQTARDVKRHQELERLGYQVEYFSYIEVVKTPAVSAQRIAEAIRVADIRSA